MPVPVEDASLSIPSVTGLIYTPIFKNPTIIGVMPGYYNSAYGITADYNVTRNWYLKYAFYDGALGTGIQTGLRAYPTFNGHHFMIGETGYAYALGKNNLPGMLSMGGWAQTGKLYGPGNQEAGAEGFYAFGSQRLWRHHMGVDNSGISGFFQFGINDSSTMIAGRYFGLGFTGFGLIPRRPADSIGTGLGWSWLNRRYGFRSNEAMLQIYYQAHLIGTTFFEPVLSYIPNPGASPRTPGALALTTQMTILF
jgi:porin